MDIVRPDGQMNADRLQHKLNVAHASGRLQPNGRARESKGQWRGNRTATRRRAIDEHLR